MKLIIGLGNPDKKYVKTRHNIGFSFINYLNKSKYNSKESTKHDSIYIETNVNGEKVILIKPLTYMNLSGISVSKWLNYYNLSIEDILVVQDDKDMELGKIKVVKNSSSGGHNGIKNIEEQLNSKDYMRLKIGINTSHNQETSSFVLDEFNKNELTIIEEKFKLLENIIEDFISYDYLNLTSKYNGK